MPIQQPTAFDEALDDLALVGAPLVVYLRVTRKLDFTEYRTLSAAALALEIHIHERTVAHAINLLVDRGYLRRGPRESATGRAYTYILVWTRKGATGGDLPSTLNAATVKSA